MNNSESLKEFKKLNSEQITEKIEFLKTLRSELIGLIISISFILDLNKSLTLESVKDQVIASW